MRKKIVAGNWKMNKSYQEGINLAKEIAAKFEAKEEVELVLIPPYIHLAEVSKIAHSVGIKSGSQNNYYEPNGAYTGEISVTQLASLKVNYGVVGHSERRKYFKEKNTALFLKIKALLSMEIQPIFCCGEGLEDRQNDLHFKTVGEQLKVLWKLTPEEFSQIIIAYEPVWAIGTGKTATAQQAQEMHAFIRALIKEHYRKKGAEECTLLYGGSCNPDNAATLFSQQDIDGGLIGGASLNADDFLSIYKALPK